MRHSTIAANIHKSILRSTRGTIHFDLCMIRILFDKPVLGIQVGQIMFVREVYIWVLSAQVGFVCSDQSQVCACGVGCIDDRLQCLSSVALTKTCGIWPASLCVHYF